MEVNMLLPGGDDGQPGADKNATKEVIETSDEVQESNDEKIDQDYPGFPHSPAREDILDPDNNTK